MKAAPLRRRLHYIFLFILQCDSLAQQSLNGKSVTVKTETAYHTFAGRREIRVMTELLTLMHVTDVHLYDGTLQ